MESLFLFTLDLLKVLIRKLEIIAQFKIQRDLVDICLNFGESKYTFDKLKEKKKKEKTLLDSSVLVLFKIAIFSL